MVHVSLDEAALLVGSRVPVRPAGMRGGCVVVIVCPFRKVVSKFETGQVGGCVLEVDDYELLVFVGWLEKRRGLVIWSNAENVSVLSLTDVSAKRIYVYGGSPKLTSLCAKTNLFLSSSGLA